MLHLPMTSKTVVLHTLRRIDCPSPPKTSDDLVSVLGFCVLFLLSHTDSLLSHTTQHNNPPQSSLSRRLVSCWSILVASSSLVFRVFLHESPSWSSPFVIPSLPKPFVFPPSTLVLGFPWFCCVFPPLSPSVIFGWSLHLCVCVIPWAERTKAISHQALFPREATRCCPAKAVTTSTSTSTTATATATERRKKLRRQRHTERTVVITSRTTKRTTTINRTAEHTSHSNHNN